MHFFTGLLNTSIDWTESFSHPYRIIYHYERAAQAKHCIGAQLPDKISSSSQCCKVNIAGYRYSGCFCPLFDCMSEGNFRSCRWMRDGISAGKGKTHEDICWRLYLSADCCVWYYEDIIPDTTGLVDEYTGGFSNRIYNREFRRHRAGQRRSGDQLS